MNRAAAAKAIFAARDAAFEWGTSDCFTLAMDVVRAGTGRAPYDDVIGAYDSPLSALRRLRERGFEGLDDAFAAVWPVIPPGAARLGDVGLTRSEFGPAAVVHDGNGWLGRAEGGGLARIKIGAVFRAYRVF